MIKVTLFVVSVFAPICLLAIPFDERATNTQVPQSDMKLNSSDTVQTLQELRDFNEFLGKCFKRTVLNYITKPLTKYGDNFHSTLLALEVKLEKSNDSFGIETLQLVVKAMLPGSVTSSESQQFWKEAHFYSDIIPALEQFEDDVNIPETERLDNSFARYYCSRLSLDPEAVSPDTDALILLENLKSINFVSLDRWNLLDKDEVLAGLKILAKFHALFIAMRRLQPDLFFSKVDPYLQNSYDVPCIENRIKRVEASIKNVPANLSNISPELSKSIENAVMLYKEFHINTNRIPDTPYTTLYHADVSPKNIMTKKNDDARTPVKAKLLDFQFSYYGSFALDLIQFIFTNGRIDDLKTDFKSFIDYYISEFVKMLRLSKFPLDDYTTEKMWNEIRDKAKISLGKLYSDLGKSKILLLDNSTRLHESKKVSEDFYYDRPMPEVVLKRWKCVTDLYVENGFI